MNRILIDLSSAQPQNAVRVNGGGEYAYRILNEIINYPIEKEIEILLNDNLGENKNVITTCKDKRIAVKRYSRIKDIEEIIDLGGYSTVVFPVCYSKYYELEISQHVKVITIIHDLCEVYYSEIHPQYGRYINGRINGLLRRWRDTFLASYHRRIAIYRHNKLMHINENQRIITVSYYTKNTFRYYLDISIEEYENIMVCYTPKKFMLSKNNTSLDFCQKYDLISEKYFLLTSACRWTKNNAIALLALDELFSDIQYENLFCGFKVLVLGVTKEYERYYKSILNHVERFVFVGYVSDEELSAIYQNMHLLLFPSLLEGFGMPPVEAMEFGKCSACSATMSIPEICGDAAIYFDPYDIESIKKAILQSFDSEFMCSINENVSRRYTWIEQKRKRDMNTLMQIVFQDELE